jgi:hypothetical protein
VGFNRGGLTRALTNNGKLPVLVPLATIGLSPQEQSVVDIALEAWCNFEILFQMYYYGIN